MSTGAVGPPAPASSTPEPSTPRPEPTSEKPAPSSSNPPPPESSSEAPPPPPSSTSTHETPASPPPSSSSETSTSTSETPTASATPTTPSTTEQLPAVTVTSASKSSSSSASSVIAQVSSPSESSTSTLVQTRTVNQSGPALNTTGRPSASAGAANTESDSSSGLSGGAIAGIVIGVLAGIGLIAFLATGYLRRRSRARRTANRSSMFEPWQTAVATEDPGYEKSYPMDTQPSFPPGADQFDPNYAYQQQGQAGFQQYPDAYGQYPNQGQFAAGYPEGAGGVGAAVGGGLAGAGTAAYVAQQGFEGPTSPAQNQADMPHAMSPPASATGHNGTVAAAGAAGVAGAAAAGAGSNVPEGLHDGMMVRVKVGFVRSLEDELAITQGQQLYLHTTYDDGWCLCEDDAHNRGVVPVSCLEPWTQ